VKWVRLDVAFARNHKILALAAQGAWRAISVYTFGLGYAGEQENDGFIPREALPMLQARPADAKKLVEVRLWIPEAGGWLINDWGDCQPSSDEMKERRDRARAAAQSRWHGKG
jgi:hypothetical protein